MNRDSEVAPHADPNRPKVVDRVERLYHNEKLPDGECDWITALGTEYACDRKESCRSRPLKA